MNFFEAVKSIGGGNENCEVGIVTEDIPGVDGYKKDNLVVFQKENYGRKGDTLTVSTPCYSNFPGNSSPEVAQLFFYNTIVNVSSKYVKKVEDLTSLL